MQVDPELYSLSKPSSVLSRLIPDSHTKSLLSARNTSLIKTQKCPSAVRIYVELDRQWTLIKLCFFTPEFIRASILAFQNIYDRLHFTSCNCGSRTS